MTRINRFPMEFKARWWCCLWMAFLGVLCFEPDGSAHNPEPHDRLAAEWVIRMGGSVLLEGQSQVISELEKLPPTDFRIRSISLVGTLIEPSKLALLSPLTDLKELFLPASMWNPQSDSKLDANDELRHLAGLVSLEKLHISHHFLEGIHIEDKGIAHLARLENLQELRLPLTKVKGTSLAPFQHLRFLDLTFTPLDDE